MKMVLLSLICLATGIYLGSRFSKEFVSAFSKYSQFEPYFLFGLATAALVICLDWAGLALAATVVALFFFWPLAQEKVYGKKKKAEPVEQQEQQNKQNSQE